MVAMVELPLLLRYFWLAMVGACILGMLPLGPVKELMAELSRRGKLKLSSSTDKPPWHIVFLHPTAKYANVIGDGNPTACRWCNVDIPLLHLSRFTVPAHWFTHFYMCGLVVNTSVLALTLSYAHACANPDRLRLVQTPGAAILSDQQLQKFGTYSWSTVLLLALLETQLLRRLYECLFVFYNNPLARMNVVTYGLGLLYYTGASLTLFSLYFRDESYTESVWTFAWQRLGHLWVLQRETPPFELKNLLQEVWLLLDFITGLDYFQWVGLTVFAVGWSQQYRSHVILASLRSKPKQGSGLTSLKSLSGDHTQPNSYGIPRGGWFELVSCAHYLAEIVLYLGIVIASRGTNFNVWLLFSWVVANLVLVAPETHQWYLQKFEEYPQNRRAIIPFIY